MFAFVAPSQAIADPPPPPEAPANLSPPPIGGLIDEGGGLTAHPGTWSGGPSVFTYEWLRCVGTDVCGEVPIGYGPYFALTTQDTGFYIRLKVTAIGPGGSGVARSVPVGPIRLLHVHPPVGYANIAPPVISGQPRLGEPLDASEGLWHAFPPVFGAMFQWHRCNSAAGCSPISGAQAGQYVPTAADVDQQLKVEVFVPSAISTLARAESGLTPPVSGAAVCHRHAPLPLALPQISSSAASGAPVGSVLSATTGSWNDCASLIYTYLYQWYHITDAGIEFLIPEAIDPQYTVTDADHNLKLAVKVTAFNDYGASIGTRSSNTFYGGSTSPYLPNSNGLGTPPENTTPPFLGGFLRAGRSLTTSNGSWTIASSQIAGYTYQWFRNSVPIPNATSQSYLIDDSDANQSISARVIAWNASGAGLPAMSNAVTPQPRDPPPSPEPFVPTAFPNCQRGVRFNRVVGFASQANGAGATWDVTRVRTYYAVTAYTAAIQAISAGIRGQSPENAWVETGDLDGWLGGNQPVTDTWSYYTARSYDNAGLSFEVVRLDGPGAPAVGSKRRFRLYHYDPSPNHYAVSIADPNNSNNPNYYFWPNVSGPTPAYHVGYEAKCASSDGYEDVVPTATVTKMQSRRSSDGQWIQSDHGELVHGGAGGGGAEWIDEPFTFCYWLNDGTNHCQVPTSIDKLSFDAIADAYVDEGSPDSSFGSGPILRVGNTVGVLHQAKEALIMFDVESWYPHVTAARLRLCAANDSIQRADISVADGSWDESVTWNTAPSGQPPFASLNGEAVRAGECREIPIDPFMFLDFNPTHQYSFRLSMPSEVASSLVTDYHSRESSLSPRLTLYFGS